MNRRENNKMESCVILRPASSGEIGLFFALSKAQNEKLGTVDHLRIDFDSNRLAFFGFN